MTDERDSEKEVTELVEEIRREVERVLVVTVDAKTGEIVDASVQKLEGFIRVLAEAAEARAETGEPIKLTWQPSGSSWWKPNR